MATNDRFEQLRRATRALVDVLGVASGGIPHTREVMNASADAVDALLDTRDDLVEMIACGEAFDCGMAAYAPQRYMVAADQKLARDREWAKAEVRDDVAKSVLDALSPYVKHQKSCARMQPPVNSKALDPACDCGLERVIYGKPINRSVTISITGPKHVDADSMRAAFASLTDRNPVRGIRMRHRFADLFAPEPVEPKFANRESSDRLPPKR